MNIKPIKLEGNWDEGYALDSHVVSSTPKGENVYGHMEYDTVRSELGELLFQFKYRNKYKCIESIIELIKPFLDSWKVLKDVNIILPVPSSNQRTYQPAVEIAISISEYLDLSFTDKVLKKTSNQQSKNMNRTDKNLKNSFVAKVKAKKPHNILLVDDLFSTGESFRECVSILKQDPNLKKIYVLAMTKARG